MECAQAAINSVASRDSVGTLHKRYGWQTSAYAQEIPKTVTLALAQSQGNTAPPRVGASVPAGTLVAGIGQSAVGAGSPGVQLGQAQSVGTITQIAGNSLFRVNPAPSSRYLVETDPRFASYQTWLSSDYLLSALRVDPATLQKRLGDGFYEQRLINEQVAQLTGQRFLQGFASDEAQYRALIDSGVTVARQWSLRPGIALSAEQMAQLTSDIVGNRGQTLINSRQLNHEPRHRRIISNSFAGNSWQQP